MAWEGSTKRTGVWIGVALAVSIGLGGPEVAAQVPVEGEVRQLVTFTFLAGSAGEGTALFQEQARPLYAADEHMLSFRAFREVESPVSLDLIVVSAFQGMAGMDRSNSRLGELAAAAGTSVGAVYGGIAALSTGHTDQFIEILPDLGSGDPASSRLTAFVWYRVAPGQHDAFERAIESLVRRLGHDSVPSTTGRFVLSDGWDYLRILGFDSLGHYQDYQEAIQAGARPSPIEAITVQRRQVIMASLPELSVR